ncbi:hypothetical protein [Umezawaea sp. Da 62-37]|uniref:dTMP kinase n=1 Tax=Umezawaea sp. Da 62-37 TaxID=3075927 RepID=UPI0028F7020A|nr:hypothetical protein [Umezawaea sp. Da 62-37]WNV82883.1 hypothetical protein RM788_32415 [Umezawaea sp. Da 62-37]
MSAGRVHLAQGSLVVLEGLDRSGKTTQRDRLKRLDWITPAPVFTHMPSGLKQLTEGIYRLTEDATISSPLARQLLHLACHAENVSALACARAEGGVVLDRWWWSTVAYGWFAGRLADAGLAESVFFGLIDAVWSQHPANLVFLFTNPYVHDTLNRDEVRDGYSRLAAQYPDVTVQVPVAEPDEVTNFLVTHLRDAGLLLSEDSSS